MIPDRLGPSMQENLLVLLCWSAEHAQFVRSAVPLDLFESYYREIAARSYDYIDKFREPPKEHVADLFDEILEGKDERRKRAISDLLYAIHEAKDDLNTQFVLSNLRSHLKQMTMKKAIIDASNHLLTNTTEGLDRATDVIRGAMKEEYALFEPGVSLLDTRSFFEYHRNRQANVFRTGIKEFDRRGIGPIRGGLHLFIALPKSGKTWYLVNLGKRAMKQRLKVCHVTLEMGEQEMKGRYYQAFLGLSKRKERQKRIKLDRDELGRVISLDDYSWMPKLALDEENAEDKIDRRVKKLSRTMGRLVIKQYPDGALTMRELRAYLENLEATQNFIPDLLIVDYADKMALPSQEHRIALGRNMIELRGLAVERNCALATASQGNRAGLRAKMLTEENVAEDFSKIAVADSAVAYSSTVPERNLGLARLYVLARGDEDRFVVVVSQSYATGQFSLDSARVLGGYQDLLDRKAKSASRDEEDDE